MPKEFKTPERVRHAQRAVAALKRSVRELESARALIGKDAEPALNVTFAFEEAKGRIEVAQSFAADHLRNMRAEHKRSL